MSNIISELQAMYDAELFSNVIKVCDLSLTAADQKPEMFPPRTKLLLVLLHASSLYHTQQYAQAESLFRQAMQIKKNIKLKGGPSSATSAAQINTPQNKINAAANANSSPATSTSELPSDVDIKYRIYECCLAQKQKNAAIEILQLISHRLRTPKINMALGNLYRDSGMDRSAITCYKEVLRKCPLALEACENLLKLGVKGIEVNTLMVNENTMTSETAHNSNWLLLWLKAQAMFHAGDFEKAMVAFKELNSFGLLKDNPTLLVTIAYCLYYLNQERAAIQMLQKALRLDQNLTFGLDLLSTLYVNTSSLVNNTASEYSTNGSGATTTASLFDSIIPSTTCGDMSQWRTEHWVVLGNFMLATKKYEKAAYYGQQALVLASPTKNIEALVLKSRALSEMGKYQDAVYHCQEALKMCTFRYDVYRCLVECYIKMNRLKEAEAMAVNACKHLNYNPQALTLHAQVLLKDPLTSTETMKKLLERAVQHDKTLSTDCVFMLVEALNQEQHYEETVQVLLQFVGHIASSRLHQTLGDTFAQLQKEDEAFHHYNVALKIDPNNQRATEGLVNMGQGASNSGKRGEGSYYTNATDHSQSSQAASSQEVLGESDIDIWPNNTFE